MDQRQASSSATTAPEQQSSGIALTTEKLNIVLQVRSAYYLYFSARYNSSTNKYIFFTREPNS